MRLIIMEDEDIIRQGLVQTIDWQMMGVSVIGSAADGEEGLTLVRELAPDVILTDIRMPRLSGLEMAQKLRTEGNEVPIVFLTSYADFSYAQQAVRLGAADYLLKPVDEMELMHIFEQLGKKIEKQLGEVFEDDKLLDWQSCLQNNALNPYVREVLAIITRDYPKHLNIESLADRQGVSASYLSRKLKEATGHTFGSLLARYRLRQSLVLLREGRLRVYEIAEQTGFGEYKNYAQVFKKYLHTSPTLFLQEIKKHSLS